MNPLLRSVHLLSGARNVILYPEGERLLGMVKDLGGSGGEPKRATRIEPGECGPGSAAPPQLSRAVRLKQVLRATRLLATPCPKCGGKMKPGILFAHTQPPPGQCLSPGPAERFDCMKCEDCGHSIIPEV